MQFVVPAFAARYGASKQDDLLLTQHLPALISGIEHMRIDLTPLLVFGSVRMDLHAFHRVSTEGNPALSTLAKTLKLLQQYELLKTDDFGSFSPVQEKFIQSRLADTKEERERWLKIVRDCIQHWVVTQKLYEHAYGGELSTERELPFLVHSALNKLGENFTTKNGRHFMTLALGNNSKSIEAEQVQDACIEAAASYVSSIEVWRSSFSNGGFHPIHDWENLANLVTQNDAHRYDQFLVEQKISVARFTIEKYTNKNPKDIDVEKYIAFLKSKRVEDFRSLINETVSACADLEEEDHQAYLKMLDDSNLQDSIRPAKVIISSVAPGISELTEFGVSAFFSAPNQTIANVTENYIDAALEKTLKQSVEGPNIPLRVHVGKSIRKYLR